MAPTTPPPAPRSGSRAGDFGSVSLRKLRRDVAEASHHCLACEAKRTFGLPAILAEGHQLGGRVDGLGEVLQEVIEVPASGHHRSIASSRMR